MYLPPYTQEICKFLPLKCLRYRSTCWQNLCWDFFVLDKLMIIWEIPNHFPISSRNSVYHGSESISNLQTRAWNIVSDRLKDLNSISSFKNEIKRWHAILHSLHGQISGYSLKYVRVGYANPIYPALVFCYLLQITWAGFHF